MRNSVKVVLFAAFSVMLVAGANAAEQQRENISSAGDIASQPVIHASGVVKDIDLNSKKITIAHEAIPAVGWPAMTMRFTFTDVSTIISKLKAGSHVDFSFVQQGNISLLKSIEATKS